MPDKLSDWEDTSAEMKYLNVPASCEGDEPCDQDRYYQLVMKGTRPFKVDDAARSFKVGEKKNFTVGFVVNSTRPVNGISQVMKMDLNDGTENASYLKLASGLMMAYLLF